MEESVNSWVGILSKDKINIKTGIYFALNEQPSPEGLSVCALCVEIRKHFLILFF